MIKVYLASMLATIYQAKDRLGEIPAEQWNDDLFFHFPTRTSNLFGHYVRGLDKNKNIPPESISFNTYMVEAAPLAHAMNEMLEQFDSLKIWDAYSVAAGLHQKFTNPCPRGRAMDFFTAVEAKFPRPALTEAEN